MPAPENINAPGAPSVGRIVHFYTSDKAKHSNGVDKGPYPAIITQVFPGSPHCNIKVFPPFRTPYDEGSVPEHDVVQAPERYWCWPPRV
jgi:hypothetical protein